MGSLNGRISVPYLGPYAASKHALEALSDALRIELRTWGISVSLIEPGAISTPIWEKSFAAADALEAEAAPEGVALYEADLAAVRAVSRQRAQSASPVEHVVRAVVHALTARRPKPRYPIGFQTRFLFFAHGRVPDRIWDWILKRTLGLP